MRIRLLAIATFLSLCVTNAMLSASGPTLAQVERELVNSPVEIGVFFSRDGRSELDRFTGTADGVPIPDRLIGKMSDTIFTHNHTTPSNSTLSVADIEAAAGFDLYQMRSVSRSLKGKLVVCIATKLKGGHWPPIFVGTEERFRMAAAFNWLPGKTVAETFNAGWKKYLPKWGISYKCS